MQSNSTIRPSVKPLFYFLRRYKRIYGPMLLLILLASSMESLSVAAFFPVFSSLLGNSQEQGGLLAFITDISSLLPFADPIVQASVLLVVVFFIKTALTLGLEMFIAFSSAKVLYDVKQQVMEKHAGAQYQFFLDSKQGTLMYKGLIAPYAVGTLLLKAPQMASFLLKILSVAVVLLLIFPLATGAVAVLGLSYYLVIHYLSTRVSYQLAIGKFNAGNEQTVITNEFITGIHQIIALRGVRHWVDNFRRANRTYCDLHGRQMAWNAAPRPIMEFFGIALMLGLILIIRVTNANNFSEVLPRLAVFAAALAQLLPSITAIGRTRMDMMTALPEADVTYQTITGPIPKRADGQGLLESFNNALAFENVSFAHKERDNLLNNVDLTFEKGKVTAIVGPSGSGKTTIIGMFLGLFDPTGGRITIDGVPLHDIKWDMWLSKIGFVSQEPFTFHSTVADNIVFGRKGHSMESVINAAKIANAHGFISELPDAYDTIVGERGMKLSGGQQQRIAIARAVLESPEILIFDEATSSLDTISEKIVQQAIDNVSTDRTVIIIAHRLSTITHADKIIVLENGKVVEEGTHDELLSKNGQYAQLAASH